MDLTHQPLHLALAASSDPRTLQRLQSNLKINHYELRTTNTVESCLELFTRSHFEITFIDISLFQNSFQKNQLTENDCKKILEPFWKVFPASPIIVLTSPESLRNTIRMVRTGASDYLIDPIDPIELQYICKNAQITKKLEAEVELLRNAFWRDDAKNTVSSSNPEMKKVFDIVRQVAPTNMTTLILGETGTGKGVIAKLIHNHSKRREKPFIHVHCGAIPEELIESELFGHEKGAFTHAIQKKLGKFEVAEGGTIFLDEIGTMSHNAQVKLLQVLQDHIFQRVGGTKDIHTDVRVIVASNNDLKEMSEKGTFRSDLYYRLNVFPILLPPLRERKESVKPLIQEFMTRFNQTYHKTIHSIHPSVLLAFQEYSWPGNIRELENLIERSYILESSSTLTPESFPIEFFLNQMSEVVIPIPQGLSLAEAREQAIEDFERQYLKELLSRNNGKINESSKAAQISTRQLHRMLNKYEIDKNAFKPSKTLDDEE